MTCRVPGTGGRRAATVSDVSDTLDVAPAPPDATPPTTRGAWAGLRPLLVRLHFHVGLFVGPFVLVAADIFDAPTHMWHVSKIIYDNNIYVTCTMSYFLTCPV